MQLSICLFEYCINHVVAWESLLAQVSQSAGTNWVDVFRKIDTGKLTIMLVFGTGIIYAVGFAIASAIRALNSSPDDADELQEKIDSLERRLESVEQQLKVR